MAKSMNRKFATSQGGAALVVGLVLLIAMTMLGLASTRSMRMEQQMAAATLDMNLAFQSAEAGLRDAQRCVRQNIHALPTHFPDMYGFYEGEVDPNAGVPYRFEEGGWSWDDSDQAITYDKSGYDEAKSPPQYYIARIKAGEGTLGQGQTRHNTGPLKDQSHAYQIISRGQGKIRREDGSTGTEIVLKTAVQF